MSYLRLVSRLVSTTKRSSIRLGPLTGLRSYSAGTDRPRTLDEWIASPPTFQFTDHLNVDHYHDLLVTLPTRDGSQRPFEEPHQGLALPHGSHLAFFYARTPEWKLREDGTDEEISPPAPFLQRMWVGGKINWDNTNPLLLGHKTVGSSSVAQVLKKGFEKDRPMVFVTQKIEFTMAGKEKPSIIEERQHVYLPEGRPKRKEPRPVPDIPSSVDFSFTYKPTAVTLFRFSALMFNAHHIHLDPEYTQKVEGYPERLVHGPLTAMMLVETFLFHNPLAYIKQFEYRATNPLYLGCELTINGTWLDETTARLWCVDNEGAVGMIGLVKTEV